MHKRDESIQLQQGAAAIYINQILRILERQYGQPVNFDRAMLPNLTESRIAKTKCIERALGKKQDTWHSSTQ